MANILDQMMLSYNIKTKEEKHNATREIMQQVCLAGLQRAGFFNKAAFYGSTCLRIFHGLNRFSEDMDFSLLQKDADFKLEDYFEAIHLEFSALGRDISIDKKIKKKNTHIESAFPKDNTDIVNIKFQTEPSIKIKIEVDKMPPLNFKTEHKLLLQPFSFMTRCFTLPGLFAGKMHALLFRKWKNRLKGRDWYDFEWYVRNNIPLDFEHFKERAAQSEDSDYSELSHQQFYDILKQKISNTKIDMVKADVYPFIINPGELDVWSNDYFLQIADMVKIEQP